MARRLLLLCAAAAVLTLPATTASAASCSGADTKISATTISSARAAILCLLNNERTARGLNALAQEDRLQLAAQRHSDDMVLSGFFAHENLLGLDPFARIRATGYEFSSAGENIAAGQTTPRAAMEGWMASTGHCRNILNDSYTELGVGINALAATIPDGVGTWTQNFGRPEDVPAPSNPDNVEDVCPEDALVAESGTAPDGADVPVPGTGDLPSPDTGDDFPAGTPTKLTLSLKRTPRLLVIAGRLAKADGTKVRVAIFKAGKRVLRITAQLADGRYRVRVKTPPNAGRLKVLVRAAGQRATRTSPSR